MMTRSRKFYICIVSLTSWILSSSASVRDLHIVTPLQALTIPDGGFEPSELSRRQAFLERFKAGLEAEMKVLGKNAQNGSSLSFLDKEAERAFETATQQVAAQQEARRKMKQIGNNDGQQYQFVGVIQPPRDGSTAGGASISWYARPKPRNARWSMRLVHVNREAVIKHLFDQGKVDIYGKYQTVTDAETGERRVESKYMVRPRSWRNAWGTHPKRWFTESSGMFWRERRLREGLYTDGKNVYEATYRYQDGRNGMHLRSSLGEYLNSRSIDDEQKEKVRKQLESSPPDVVLEL